MKPELHTAAMKTVSSTQAVENAIRVLSKEAAGAPRWLITVPNQHDPSLQMGWNMAPAPGATGRGKFVHQELNPATGEKLSEARETAGGDFLYRLHFNLHYLPVTWGRWLVGFCAMFMLVAIISGVITHKHIFKDFFTFRPGKGQRSWLDAHSTVAVLALPYHLMVTYTGLVMLMFMYMPGGVQVAYHGNEEAFFAEAFPTAENKKPADIAAPLAPLAPMIEQARAHWNGGEVHRVIINNPGDAHATINITRQREVKLSSIRQAMQFDGVTGELIKTSGDVSSKAAESRGVMMGLHLAHFTDGWFRFLYFLCGLAGYAMVATGALLWAVKKRNEQAKVLAKGGRLSVGLRLVEALNIGVIAGLPIAYASYFWANRLLPVGMETRAEAEVSCFFIAWGVALLLAQIKPTRRMWQIFLGIGGTMFISLPLLNVFTTGSHLGVTLFQGRGPSAVAGFDLFTLVFGFALLYAAHHLQKKKRALKTRVKIPSQPVVSPKGHEPVTAVASAKRTRDDLISGEAT